MFEVEALQEKTDTLASKTWVEDVDKRLRKLQVQVNELPTMEFLIKKLDDLERNSISLGSQKKNSSTQSQTLF